MGRAETEAEWAVLMTAAIDGDDAAYQRLLTSLAGSLRGLVRRGCQRAGRPTADVEDVVQAKLRGRTVGLAAVQQAAGARLHYGANRAMVVTNATFTPAARELAATNDVVLWDRDDIARELLTPRGHVAAVVTG